jgi:hypothetical protein
MSNARPERFLQLSRLQYVYALALLLVIVASALVFERGRLESLWCEHVEVKEYEPLLGFTLDRLPSRGETTGWPYVGFTSVDPAGHLGRAGLHAGDLPYQHRGEFDLCVDLAAVVAGEARQLHIEVQVEGRLSRVPRLITVPGLIRHTTPATKPAGP